MARRRSSPRLHPFASLVATVGVAFVGLLLFLIHSYSARPLEDAVPYAVSPPVGEDWQQTFKQRLDAVTALLEQRVPRLPRPTVEMRGSGPVEYSHRRYELTVPREEEEKVVAALEAARGGDPTVAVSVERKPDGMRADIGVDGLLTHRLVVHWRLAEHRGPGRVAVIIDDLGNDLLVAREVVRLDFPVALAVMPLRPFTREVAALAEHYGRDVLLHLPMEAESGAYAQEEVFLRADAPKTEILREVERGLSSVPQAVGVNNHMGSRFTQDRARMRWVLEYLKERGLFFVDSGTSDRTVAQEVAAAVGVPYLARRVFLDATGDRTGVRQRLAELLAEGRRRGAAIGIGHPHRSTLAALRSFGAMAKERGVQVVRLSSLAAERGG